MKRLWVALLFLGVALVLFIGAPAFSGGEKNPCIEQLVKLSFLRFTDNGDGTVTDNWTGLVWMKHASDDGDAVGFAPQTWANACADCNGLEDGENGLTDGSQPGDWRLPNNRELQSLVDYGVYDPALPSGHPFVGVQSLFYWSSTTLATDPTDRAWYLHFNVGLPGHYLKDSSYFVWCVRGGK